MEEWFERFTRFVDEYVADKISWEDPYRQGYVDGYADALEYVRDWIGEEVL